jgi:hypothetical protein
MAGRVFHTVWLVAVTVLVGSSLLPGTSAQPAQAPGAMEQLLIEVRGLRAEVSQAAGASIRTQLLVARLQLQEQRITNLVRQLTEVQTDLAEKTRGRAETLTELKRLEEAENRPLSPEERQQVDQQIKAMKSHLEHELRHHQELLQREAALTDAVSGEQARWSDFNNRLDEIERSLQVK